MMIVINYLAITHIKSLAVIVNVPLQTFTLSFGNFQHQLKALLEVDKSKCEFLLSGSHVVSRHLLSANYSALKSNFLD